MCMDNLDPQIASDLRNLMSGALGAFVVLLIQYYREWYKEERIKTKTRNTIHSYLQNIILGGLNKLPASYNIVVESLDLFIGGNNPGGVLASDYNEINSGYIRNERFMSFIENQQNYDLQVLYIDLANQLDFFKNRQPSDIIIDFGTFYGKNPTPEDAIAYAIRLRFLAQNAQNNIEIAIQKVNQLLVELRKNME